MNNDVLISLDKKLDQLVSLSTSCHEEYSQAVFSDPNNKLSELKKKGLCRVLSGVASTELLEELLLTPLIEAEKNKIRKEYFRIHSQDEERHFQLLSRYLKSSFGFVKTKKTLSDYLFYGFFFPVYVILFKKKPLYTLILIYCFETLSIYFYNHILLVSKREDLNELTKLLELIKKDEMRHIAGIKTQMNIMATMGHPAIGKFGRAFIKTLLNFFILDVSMSKWDFHNRSMRQRMKNLGVDTEKFTSEIKANKKQTMAELNQIFNK
jgi:hypothetical protein